MEKSKQCDALPATAVTGSPASVCTLQGQPAGPSTSCSPALRLIALSSSSVLDGYHKAALSQLLNKISQS